MSRFSRVIQLTFVAVFSVSLGAWFTRHGVNTWDSLSHYSRSQWLIQHFGFTSNKTELLPNLKWYGPLWETFLGFWTEVVFRELRDPAWVRYAFTFALYPFSLFVTYLLLKRSKVRTEVAILAISFLYGFIRLTGHALVNVTDFPFAASFWLVSLGGWVLLSERRTYSYGFRFMLAGLGVIPYLIRPPALLHPVLFCIFFLIHDRKLLRAAGNGVLFVVFSLFWIVISWPSIWIFGVGEWIQSFLLFSRYPWEGEVRVLGTIYHPHHLPAWYPLAWMPISLHPLVLSGLVAGLGSYVLRLHKITWQPSLAKWLALVALCAWSAVILGKPHLYDEDRHLLFLLPPLLILAAVGLQRLPNRLLYLFSVTIILASSATYLQWGAYSYVYQSPLIGNRDTSAFMGDYWGVCINEAIRALPGVVQDHRRPIVVKNPFEPAQLQFFTLKQARYTSLAGFDYQLVSSPTEAPYIQIFTNRMGDHLHALDEARQGRAKILWQSRMPLGEVGCVIAEFNAQ